ncbi:hypothetical protein OF117_06890 [Geodermatophilus sp. YIM 151500]|uniref:hypothetical protein n=1 Tax=Geodermatophilus sp. YIM 151500 TaxID=2984531 RepID=UPI0021E484CC|nr:hypothetical protein [Geodermatophilus sp. YIM 151500]MCV2489085.1 hypothetical protein [Geodermatophilus sp. YIM 151500]
MSEQHPEPGGTPEPGSSSLTRTPTTTEQSRAGEVDPPVATPGAHDADDAERARGRAVKPGG